MVFVRIHPGESSTLKSSLTSCFVNDETKITLDVGMCSEESRLKSFQRRWSGNNDPEILAKAGFYFTGLEDIVQCFVCKVSLYRWKNNDDPWADHALYSPNCRFVRSSQWYKKRTDDCAEKKGVAAVPTTTTPPGRGRDVCGITDVKFRTSTADDIFVNVIFDANGVVSGRCGSINSGGEQRQTQSMLISLRELQTAMYPYYSDQERRAATFDSLPMNSLKAYFAKAGFFLASTAIIRFEATSKITGSDATKNDLVVCYSCGLGLQNWSMFDDPWREHIKHSDACEYVINRLSAKRRDRASCVLCPKMPEL